MRSGPTSRSYAGCSPVSSRNGPSCGSCPSSRTGPITTSTASALTWPSGYRASDGPPGRPSRRRRGCRSSRRTCRSRYRSRWRWGVPPRAIRSPGRCTPGCPVTTPTARSSTSSGRPSTLPRSSTRYGGSTRPVRLHDVPEHAARRSRRTTRTSEGPLWSSATGSTAMPHSAPGRSRSTRRPGPVGTCGYTVTCCRVTCSSSTAACSAVIDFGLSVGDPACDLQAAWNVFAGESRQRFRAELAVDDASWLRGRGWALCQAVVALPYYWDTNPGMIRQASHALTQVLAATDGATQCPEW